MPETHHVEPLVGTTHVVVSLSDKEGPLVERPCMAVSETLALLRQMQDEIVSLRAHVVSLAAEVGALKLNMYPPETMLVPLGLPSAYSNLISELNRCKDLSMGVI